MGVEKMSVSFDLDLGAEIRRAASSDAVSVSKWLAEAARDRLRAEALDEALTEWQAEFGELTEAELNAAHAAREQVDARQDRRPGRRSA